MGDPEKPISRELEIKEAFSVVFLLDSIPPSKIVLLKRASWKKFAPDVYTGIGGTFEKGEEVQANALRELQEETGLVDISLFEFAQCILLQQHRIVHYLWGIYSQSQLPSCNEGDLEWVEIPFILDKDIITTTKLVVAEWQRRSFSLEARWTLFASDPGEVDDWRHRILDRVEEGLRKK